MKIASVKHKGLRRFIGDDDASGLPATFVDKIRKMVTFLQGMEHEEELDAVPAWRAHRLSGNRRGTWSLTVSRNWRLTFRVDASGPAIIDLDFEDYH